jgi:hypothetical protein
MTSKKEPWGYIVRTPRESRKRKARSGGGMLEVTVILLILFLGWMWYASTVHQSRPETIRIGSHR